MSDPRRSCKVDGEPDVGCESAFARAVGGSVEGIAGRAVIEPERGETELRQASCELDERRVRVRVLEPERRAENDRPARRRVRHEENAEER